MAGRAVMEALQLRKKGYNCAQSVGVPLCDMLGVDKELAFKALEGFGGGMGCYGLTCGALSAAVFAVGLKYSDGNLEVPESKRNTYAICEELVQKFTKEMGTNCCLEIRGTNEPGHMDICDKCVMVATNLAEKVIG